MLNRGQKLLLLLAVLLLSPLRLLATSYPEATIAISGLESQSNGVWASGDITVSFNAYTETIHYGQFSTPESIAAGLAAMFTRDYHHVGLNAKAGAHQNLDLNVITFQLFNGGSFGPVNITQNTPFVLSPSAFPPPGTVTADSGTVTLRVNNAIVSEYSYGANTTSEDIASGLAQNASTGLVSVQSSGQLLYLTSATTGAASNYPYSLTIAHDTTDFPNASFHASPSAGSLSGGSDASGPTAASQVYCFSVTGTASCDLTDTAASGYDAAGNIVGMTDSVMGQWSYSYDVLDRLISGTAATGPYVARNESRICWSYDSFGNRMHQTLSSADFADLSNCSVAGGATSADTVAAYDVNNRLTSVKMPGSSTAVTPSYDAAGDVVADPRNTYLYDAEGRICAVHGAFGMTGYLYNAAGARVGKGTITSMSCDVTANGYQPISDFIVGASGQQVTELAVSESASASWQHTNVWADGQLISTYDQAGLHFYLNDALGTRRAQTDQAGVAEQTCASLPYGDQLDCGLSVSAPTEQHFTGKERDAESGLDYFGARYYNSAVGRWMSPDWSAKEEPVPYAKLDDPQSLNLYGYVGNNPLNKADPDGHLPEWMQRLWRTVSYPGILYDKSLSPSQRQAAIQQALAQHEAARRQLIVDGAALLAAAASSSAPLNPEGCRPSIWDLGPGPRGMEIEARLGGNLPRGFPTIDRFINGEATSIKSLDLSAKSYQDPRNLTSTVNGYIDKVAAFQGARQGDTIIQASQITGRELQLAVPGTGTAAQQTALRASSDYATQHGVKLTITQVH